MAEKNEMAKGRPGRPKGGPATMSQRYTVEQIAEALRKGAGIRSHAAKILGVSAPTMTRLVNKYPELEDVISETKQRIVDMAQAKLIEAVKKGNMTAIIFTLKAIGGYSERHVMTGPGGGPIEVKTNEVDRDALIRTIDERIARHGGEEEPGS